MRVCVNRALVLDTPRLNASRVEILVVASTIHPGETSAASVHILIWGIFGHIEALLYISDETCHCALSK